LSKTTWWRRCWRWRWFRPRPSGCGHGYGYGYGQPRATTPTTGYVGSSKANWITR